MVLKKDSCFSAENQFFHSDFVQRRKNPAHIKEKILMELSVFSIAAVFLSSLVAAMGLGGGTVLLLYLSFFSTLSQPQMQSLNLLLFLPAAALSLFFHWKNKLISFSLLKPCIPGGIIGGILEVCSQTCWNQIF